MVDTYRDSSQKFPPKQWFPPNDALGHLGKHEETIFFLFFFKAWLQLRVLFGKQRKVHPSGMRAGQPQRRGHEETILIHREKPYLSKISIEASIFT